MGGWRMKSVYYSRRKIVNEKHKKKNNNNDFKKRNVIEMIQSKLSNLSIMRKLVDIEVRVDEKSHYCALTREGICIFKVVLSVKGNQFFVWDRLYGDKWFVTKGINTSDLDEAINYFEQKRLEKIKA